MSKSPNARERAIARHKRRDTKAKLLRKLQMRTLMLRATKARNSTVTSKLKNIKAILEMGLDETSTIKLIRQTVSTDV